MRIRNRLYQHRQLAGVGNMGIDIGSLLGLASLFPVLQYAMLHLLEWQVIRLEFLFQNSVDPCMEAAATLSSTYQLALFALLTLGTYELFKRESRHQNAEMLYLVMSYFFTFSMLSIEFAPNSWYDDMHRQAPHYMSIIDRFFAVDYSLSLGIISGLAPMIIGKFFEVSRVHNLRVKDQL